MWWQRSGRRRRPAAPAARIGALASWCWVLLTTAVVVPVVATTGLLLRPTHADVELAVEAAPAATPSLPAPAGEVVRLTSGGRERAVLVQDPPAGVPARALVMVLGPHALTASDAATALRLDGLRARGWAVAYPSTLDGDWNAGRCCGTPQREDVDDVRFLQDARGMLLARYGLGDDRIGLVGYSTGGQMAYRTVCEHPRFARALVVVAGSMETDCRPPSSLPATLVVHGLDDSTVPWAITTHRTQLLDFAPRPARTSIAAYAEAAGCRSPRVDDRDGRTLLGWDTCTGAPLLSVVGMPGTGHGWEPLGASTYVTRFLPRWLDAG